jgi:hypothetical protein
VIYSCHDLFPVCGSTATASVREHSLLARAPKLLTSWNLFRSFFSVGVLRKLCFDWSKQTLAAEKEALDNKQNNDIIEKERFFFRAFATTAAHRFGIYCPWFCLCVSDIIHLASIIWPNPMRIESKGEPTLDQYSDRSQAARGLLRRRFCFVVIAAF